MTGIACSRPYRRRTTQCNKFPPPHNRSITSSARASSSGGTTIPSAYAAFRLITASYLVGACTVRSAGFSPIRIRSLGSKHLPRESGVRSS